MFDCGAVSVFANGLLIFDLDDLDTGICHEGLLDRGPWKDAALTDTESFSLKPQAWLEIPYTYIGLLSEAAVPASLRGSGGCSGLGTKDKIMLHQVQLEKM